MTKKIMNFRNAFKMLATQYANIYFSRDFLLYIHTHVLFDPIQPVLHKWFYVFVCYTEYAFVYRNQ